MTGVLHNDDQFAPTQLRLAFVLRGLEAEHSSQPKKWNCFFPHNSHLSLPGYVMNLITLKANRLQNGNKRNNKIV